MTKKNPVLKPQTILACFAWCLLFAIPIYILISTEYGMYIYGSHLLISLGLIFWLTLDKDSRKSLRDEVSINYVFISMCWFVFLFALPFKLLWDERKSSPLDQNWTFKKPSDRDSEIIKSVLKEIIDLSSESKSAFESLNQSESHSQETIYSQQIIPIINRSRLLRSKVEQFLDFDLSDIEVDNINASELYSYYADLDFSLIKDPKTEDIRLHNVHGIEQFFGLLRPLYLPAEGRYARADSLSSVIEKKTKSTVTNSKWKILVTPSFKKSFKKISAEVQDRAFRCIEEILIDPRKVESNKRFPMSGDKKGLWRYRFGDYRILYDPDIENNLVIFVSISSRQNAYH